MSQTIVIIGGVAGGMTTATRLRRLDEKATIIVLERGKHVSFANCGLPYYIGDVIKSEQAVVLQTPQSLKAKFNLDVRVENEVISIDRDKKMIYVKSISDNNEYELQYDKLVISTGASPIKPPITGLDKAENLFTLRNVDDSKSIKEFVAKSSPKKAVIIGAGFIGIEMCENLHKLGIEVTLVEMQNQVLAPIDYEMATIIHKHLQSFGVKLVFENGVKAFLDNGKRIQLQDDSEIESDLTILGIGVRPESQIASAANLELNERGAIKVNQYLQTNDSNIYAIGDVIEVTDYINQQKVSIPLAWPANRQGRIVADNILLGNKISYKGTLGAAILGIFGLTVAVTGANEKTLTKLGVPYKAIHIHPGHHASYMPGAEAMTLKLLFSPDGLKILGAQGIGKEGVDKRLDVINTAIQANFSVFQLADLELSYAPEYSSAKDPVNMLGYLASNIVNGTVKQISIQELKNISNDAIILDVREEGELILGSIPNSINIPLDKIRTNLDKLTKEKPIYVYCQVGLRGYFATRILMQNGYNVYNIDGGYKLYAALYESGMQKFTTQTEDSGISHSVFFQSNSMSSNQSNPKITMQIDACGLQCPGPLLKVYEAIKEINPNDIIEISATDAGFFPDIEIWCQRTNNTLLSKIEKNGIYTVQVQKTIQSTIGKTVDSLPVINNSQENGMTLIVFDGDLDKAIAAFILANGGAAYGKEVTVFFTFWGLNILRRPYSVKVNKTPLEKMFGMMMPRGVSKLGISKMNMFGMGAAMIKYIMNKKKVDSLEQLMTKALQQNVKLVACTMSMDIMGIKKEELIDGISLGGVATYLGKAEGSNINLFI